MHDADKHATRCSIHDNSTEAGHGVSAYQRGISRLEQRHGTHRDSRTAWERMNGVVPVHVVITYIYSNLDSLKSAPDSVRAP